MGDEESGSAGRRELTPRERQRRRRRWRHVIGWLLFLLVAGGILYAAYATFGGGSSDDNRAVGTTAAPTTTTVAPAGPFKTNAGVNVRTGPATTQPIVATLDLGTEVMVVCAIQGEPVNTGGGPQTIWVKVTAGATTGYVSAVYVDIGQVLADPAKIGECPPV
ncbi:MAG: SH3 domain-containing protein [Acidimicrobiia bacterium]